MYVPPVFKEDDPQRLAAFIQKYSFATLVSGSKGSPQASHLPFLFDESRGKLGYLRGHMAKANPHWKSVGQDQESLAIFHGPHAYISPSLYETRESVPTWNYAAVHVYGRGTFFTDEAQLRQLLQEVIGHFDSSYAAQWPSLSEQYQSRMLQHIVGFEINATRVEAKFKLSQNRTKAERENVIKSLERSSDSAVAVVASLMKERSLGST